MYIIRWRGQTCFGPFPDLLEAHTWLEKAFGDLAILSGDFVVHFVEPPFAC